MAGSRRSVGGESERTPRITPAIPRAEAKAREREVLRACNVDDFEFLSVVGGGCSGIVCLARCKNRANPFADTKVYAIKIVMNMHSDPTKTLRRKYQKEFDVYDDLLRVRLEYEAAGKRDGLVTYYHSFTGPFPEAVRPMLKPEVADVCFPPAAGVSNVVFMCCIYLLCIGVAGAP